VPVWDEENRLRLVDTNPSTKDPEGIAVYTYDAGGERAIKKVINRGKWTVNEPNTISTGIMRGSFSANLYPSGLLNLSVTKRGCDRCNPYELRYTKHYYAGSQRVMSKIGSDQNIGKFDCSWLIIPFSEGATPAEKPEETLAKADKSEAKLLKAYNITPAPDYGQNAGYAQNCVSSHGIDFAVEKAQSYWYHSDHLGSASYITGADGKVCSNINYFPTGEVFVEQNRQIFNLPYKFNGKELDSETGYYYYGARYYNPKVSLWLNVDPLADYNPHMNSEHYIDGQHNGGVLNQGNGNPYIYCYQNPVKYIDPNGKQTVSELTSGPKVDMTLSSSLSLNAKGFPRDKNYFWGQVAAKNPGMFSSANMWRLDNNIAPKVDDQWIAANPSHAKYKNNRLVHHHIDQGRFAVGIPEKAHTGFFKELHNRSANWFKNNKLGSAFRSVSGITTAFDFFKIINGHPDSPFSTFQPNAPLNTLQGMSDYSSGEMSNYYYEIKSSNKAKTVFDVKFYEDFEKRDGVYRGVGTGTSSTIMIKGKEMTIMPNTSL
jgi:RHS repeat-associated protein